MEYLELLPADEKLQVIGEKVHQMALEAYSAHLVAVALIAAGDKDQGAMYLEKEELLNRSIAAVLAEAEQWKVSDG